MFHVRKVVRGVAEGRALVCPGSFSFLGDVDLDTGEIIAAGNPNRGQTLAGRILIYHASRGSSGGCEVLMSLAKAGHAPAALVSVMPADYNLAEGAILAGIPFVCEPDGDVLSGITTGQQVRVDAGQGTIEAN